MKVNQGGMGCQNCAHRKHDDEFGLICVFSKKKVIGEVEECSYSEYDSTSLIDK